MKISRYFTTEGKDPYTGIPFEPRTSEIKNTDGSKVFLMENVMVPAHWSQVATDILAQKYFRKAGLNGDKGKKTRSPITDHRSPSDLTASTPQRLNAESADHETDSRQVFHRLAGCWRHW